METVKLYYENAFLQDFTAVVESCGAVKGGFAVVLDRTAFYPEGGGQPADHGTLGDARVLDVHEKDGIVTHLCDRALPVGAEVSGHIDWARRFDHMQQHSGEHIVSGMLCSAFHCDNVGFHLGADTVTIDYNADISWEQVQDIERRANRYIWENHPIHIWYPSPEELAALPYRSKKALEGPVRLTEFPGADLCACCGTHVAASGQVGLVKFIGWQKFRDGVRLELLCGQRALDHLSACWEQSRQIGQSLSVKPEASFAAVERTNTDGTANSRMSLSLQTSSMLLVNRSSSGIFICGRLGCLRVVERLSISFSMADHTSTSFPLTVSIRARAMPQVPAPRIPIRFITFVLRIRRAPV